MSKRRTRKTTSKPNSSKLHNQQKSSEKLSETKIVIKCQVQTECKIPSLNSQVKNRGKHLHLVEKDLLEFASSLSKTIGSRRKNVLSALIVPEDITIPAFQEPEPADHSPPIHACLCELKGRDEGNVVICKKNCCCLIFLDTCHCGLQLPANPSKIRNTKRNSCNSDKNYHKKSTVTGIRGISSGYSGSTPPKSSKEVHSTGLAENSGAFKVTQDGLSSAVVENTGTAKEPAKKTETSSLPLANTAMKTDRMESLASSLNREGLPVKAERESSVQQQQGISVQVKEPQRVPLRRLLPKPGPSVQPSHPSQVSSAEFSPQLLLASNGGFPPNNGRHMIPEHFPKSYPMPPPSSFYPSQFNLVPVQQLFPPWNHVINFPTIHVPNNPTFSHPIPPFQFHGGQNLNKR